MLNETKEAWDYLLDLIPEDEKTIKTLVTSYKQSNEKLFNHPELSDIFFELISTVWGCNAFIFIENNLYVK